MDLRLIFQTNNFTNLFNDIYLLINDSISLYNFESNDNHVKNGTHALIQLKS